MSRSRRERESERKKQKRKAVRKRIMIVLAIVLAALIVNFAYIIAMNGRFYHHTTLNGYDVSGKSVDEVVDILSEPYGNLALQVKENGETVLSLDFEEMGYSINRQTLASAVREIMNRQNLVAPAALILGNDYGMRVPFDVNGDVFRTAVSGDNFSVPRTPTANAELVEKDGEFVIQPEVYGNDFEDSDLQELVKETIDKKLTEAVVESVIEVEVPQSFYRIPEITSHNEELNRLLALYNRYCKAKITYTFGEVTEVVDWTVIKDWLIDDGGEGSIDEEAVYNYVANLAAQYDTLYTQRTFETSLGTTVTLPSNDYGYQMDVDGEFSQLLEDIYANTTVEREPVYAVRGYSRNGYDDLNGTYVEVNLTTQHLWFYKEGSLVVESDIISGLPKDGRETVEGAFALPYKASPFNLVGGGGGEGESWDVEVQYWMPFHDGQGLHDASWQSNFGGTTYMTAGSHGCINLPVDVAAVIYNYIEADMAIILYK